MPKSDKAETILALHEFKMKVYKNCNSENSELKINDKVDHQNLIFIKVR